jgi:hypothetical protein
VPVRDWVMMALRPRPHPETRQAHKLTDTFVCVQVTPDDFWAASPDPVSQFSAPVCGHMNKDHSESTVAMIKYYAGVEVDSAKMLAVDRLGVDTECLIDSEPVNVRLTFPQPAEDRKSIKDRIVEMTKAASQAAAK